MIAGVQRRGGGDQSGFARGLWSHEAVLGAGAGRLEHAQGDGGVPRAADGAAHQLHVRRHVPLLRHLGLLRPAGHWQRLRGPRMPGKPLHSRTRPDTRLFLFQAHF